MVVMLLGQIYGALHFVFFLYMVPFIVVLSPYHHYHCVLEYGVSMEVYFALMSGVSMVSA